MTALWKWESDNGDKFNDFSDDHCKLLEQAFLSGQSRLEIPEKGWVFDLKRMVQTKVGGSSRAIKRCPDVLAIRSPSFAQNAPPSSAAQLPAGWVSHQMADGRIFYSNSSTNQSQWDFPSASGVAACPPQPSATLSHAIAQQAGPAQPVPPGWIMNIDPHSNKAFYINTATLQSQWEFPNVPAPIHQAAAAPPAAMAIPMAHVPASQPAVYHHAPGHQPPPQASSQHIDHEHIGRIIPTASQLHAPHALPAPWTEHVDPVSGGTYYANQLTNESTWNRPTVSAQYSADSMPPAKMQPSHGSAFIPGSAHLFMPEPAQCQQHVAQARTDPHPRLNGGRASQPAAAPVIWKWESDNGDKFNDFSDDHCKLLEQAFLSGQSRLEIPEKGWIFDLKRMVQTKVGGSSRVIKRYCDTSIQSMANAHAVPSGHSYAVASGAPHASFQPHVAAVYDARGSDAQGFSSSAARQDSASPSTMYPPPNSLQSMYPPPPGPPPAQVPHYHAPPLGNWPPPAGMPPSSSPHLMYSPPSHGIAAAPQYSQQHLAPHGAPPGSHQTGDYLPVGWRAEMMPNGKMLYTHDPSGKQSFEKPLI
jgi:hypothetical protein